MADVYRAVYVPVQGFPLAERLAALYKGQIAAGDLLALFVTPLDQRGEVDAWGGPHLTLLDALTFHDPGSFDSIVRDIVSQFPLPEIQPRSMAILGNTSLVIQCESPQIAQLRARLIQATRPLIQRSSLTREEIQKARWWLARVGPDKSTLQDVLEAALSYYRQAGSPPLPSSQHFRLGFLVRLFKAATLPGTENARADRQGQLDYFLSLGEPPWYAHPASLHLTIASGLTPGQSVATFQQSLWPSLQREFPPYSPGWLDILGEDPEHLSTVRFFDQLTETFVEETRPGLKAVEQTTFSPRETNS